MFPYIHTMDICLSFLETGDAVAPQVQCYKYSADDQLAWPYFDYLENTNVISEFLPDSDFGFTDFQEKLLAEYAADPPPPASIAAT